MQRFSGTNRSIFPDGWRPWRWPVLGWVVAAGVLALGVPLFLRMPLWCDITLYAVAARTVLEGGVHYRDVFDTNPPGFVWLMCGIRTLFGPSAEAVRAVDLVVVAVTAVMLLRWAKLGGATPAAVAWAAAGMAAFYPFTSEFNHAQRDVWILLPTTAAVLFRLRRVERARAHPVSDWWVFRGGFLEGLIWAAGFWVKPHLAPPAVAAWLVCARRYAATSARPRRRLVADLGGVLLGGSLVGAAGITWLVATGTWPHYLDVNRNWTPNYLAGILDELGVRVLGQFGYFPPWSSFLRFAVPLAVLNLIDVSPRRAWLGRLPRWAFDADAPEPRRFTRAVLAAVFLAWVATATVFQHRFHYVHVPEVFLMLALFAANRWAAGFLLIAMQVVVGVVALATGADPNREVWHDWVTEAHPVSWELTARHPAFDPARTAWWPGCFARDVPRELRKGLAQRADSFSAIDPVELGAAADFLRAQGVRDGEVVGWHDSPHALYLMLDIKPAIRFMHVGTAMSMGPWQREQVAAELRRAWPGVRFAVSDTHRITYDYADLRDVGPDGLPVLLPAWQRTQFPFDQPVVFRSPGNRYLVHKITHPLNECRIPKFLNQPDGTLGW